VKRINYLPFTCSFLLMLSVQQISVACSVCYGDPESPMIIGMNMGILTLLVFVAGIWASFAVFFLNLRKRAKVHANSLNEKKGGNS